MDGDHQVDRREHPRPERSPAVPDLHRDLYRAALGVHDGTDPGDPARVGPVRPFDVDADRLSRADLRDVFLGHVDTGEQRVEIRRTEYHVVRVHQVAHLDQPLRDDAGKGAADGGVLQLQLRRLVLGLGGFVLKLRLFEFLAAQEFPLQQFLGAIIVRFQAVHVHFALLQRQFQRVGVELGERLPFLYAVALLDQDGLDEPLGTRNHVHEALRLKRRVGEQRRRYISPGNGLHIDRYGGARARHGAHAGPAAAGVLRGIFVRFLLTSAAGEHTHDHCRHRPVCQLAQPEPPEHEPLLE